MTWVLISYSEIKMPLPPYCSEYIIGIVENEAAQRCMVQIDQMYVKELSVGKSGEIDRVNGPAGEINRFVPGSSEIK
jgi:uncharacterized OB-fold protein